MGESKKKRLSVIVHGRVQGVGFRYFVQRHAALFGLNGWVKNMPDGSVAVVAEGKADDLNELLILLRKGPSFSHVSKVDVIWGEYRGDFRSFDVAF